MSKEKIYTSEELTEKAQSVFAEFPLVAKVYATTDGNIFINENRAKLHAGKGKIVEIEKAIGAKPEKPQKQKAEELINQIALVTDLVDLEPFKIDERKTVKDAVEAKMKELTSVE